MDDSEGSARTDLTLKLRLSSEWAVTQSPYVHAVTSEIGTGELFLALRASFRRV